MISFSASLWMPGCRWQQVRNAFRGYDSVDEGFREMSAETGLAAVSAHVGGRHKTVTLPRFNAIMQKKGKVFG
jgi:hypothetical protein